MQLWKYSVCCFKKQIPANIVCCSDRCELDDQIIGTGQRRVEITQTPFWHPLIQRMVSSLMQRMSLVAKMFRVSCKRA